MAQTEQKDNGNIAIEAVLSLAETAWDHKLATVIVLVLLGSAITYVYQHPESLGNVVEYIKGAIGSHLPNFSGSLPSIPNPFAGGEAPALPTATFHSGAGYVPTQSPAGYGGPGVIQSGFCIDGTFVNNIFHPSPEALKQANLTLSQWNGGTVYDIDKVSGTVCEIIH